MRNWTGWKHGLLAPGLTYEQAWFDICWSQCCAWGQCDEKGGEQYKRVLGEWRVCSVPGWDKGDANETRRFIRSRSNAVPVSPVSSAAKGGDPIGW